MNVQGSRSVRGVAAAGLFALVAGGSVLAGTGVASAATVAGSAGAASCASGALPSVVDGSPSVVAGAPEGIYLWHTKGGYELRVTHPGTTKVVYTGTITVTNALAAVKRVKLERGDKVTVSNHRHTLHFRLTNFGRMDGINFAAECSKDVKVTVRINGTEATAGQVFLGSAKAGPSAVPFTVERGATTV